MSLFGVDICDETKGSFMLGDLPVDIMKVTNYSIVLKSTDDNGVVSLFKLDKYQLSTIKSFIKANYDDCKTCSMELKNITVESDGDKINCNIIMVSCGLYIIVSLEDDNWIYASFSVSTSQGLKICNEIQKKIKEISDENFAKIMKATNLKSGE